MDLEDVEKELQRIRIKNHDISNLLTIHSEQLLSIVEMKKDMNNSFTELRKDIECVMFSLSGGLKGQGIINRVENLEAYKKSISGWVKVLGAAVLTLLINKGWELLTYASEPVFDNHQVIRSDEKLVVSTKPEVITK